jgi:ribosomal-protein-alanine N-acetyltransferase
MSFGFEQAGSDVAAVEDDPWIARVADISGDYIRSHPRLGDRPVDELVGGAPCQANRRARLAYSRSLCPRPANTIERRRTSPQTYPRRAAGNRQWPRSLRRKLPMLPKDSIDTPRSSAPSSRSSYQADKSVRLRPAMPSDAAALAQIELEAFPDPSWTGADFLRYDCTVAEVEISPAEIAIAGFLVSRGNYAGSLNTPPEREILNLAVSAQFRRLGIAKRLLAAELARGAHVYLEVRESNSPAIQLYRNAGFTEVGRRREYYDSPVESAIVMRMKW